MFSKEEIKNYNIEFWSDFKLFMSKYRSSTGKRISWLAYPTEVKNIYLRLEVGKKDVALNFDFQFKDPIIRAVFWEQMHELKAVLVSKMGEEGNWEEHASNSSLGDFCRIQWKKKELNYLNPKDRDAIFIFFKEKLLAFDQFYQEFKEILLFLAK